MKALRIALVLSSVAAVSAAYVLLRSAPQPEAAVTPVESVEVPKTNPVKVMQSNDVAVLPEEPVPSEEPVQPLEERGDAMLFEIDALQNMPFDQSVTMPFD